MLRAHITSCWWSLAYLSLSAMEGGKRRIPEACWLLTLLLVQWETLSQENKVVSNRTGHLINSSLCMYTPGSYCTHTCAYVSTPNPLNVFIFVKKYTEVIIKIVRHIQINLRRIDIFTVLNLLIHEYSTWLLLIWIPSFSILCFVDL